MTSYFVALGVVIAVFFRVNPLLLIRNGHITPVEVRGRRGATKDSVLFGTARRQESRCLKKRNRLDHEKGILDEELSQINA